MAHLGIKLDLSIAAPGANGVAMDPYDCMWLIVHDLILTSRSPLNAIYDTSLMKLNLIFECKLLRLEEIFFKKLIYQITSRERDPEERRQASKCWWRRDVRSMEPEKADGDTVRDPGQRVQYEHGAGGVTTWVGEMLLLRIATWGEAEGRGMPKHHLATQQSCLNPDIYPSITWFFPLFIRMYYIR